MKRNSGPKRQGSQNNITNTISGILTQCDTTVAPTSDSSSAEVSNTISISLNDRNITTNSTHFHINNLSNQNKLSVHKEYIHQPYSSNPLPSRNALTNPRSQEFLTSTGLNMNLSLSISPSKACSDSPSSSYSHYQTDVTLNPISPSPLFSPDEMGLDELVSSFHEHLNQIQISTNSITHILKSIESKEKLMLNGSRDAVVIDRPLTSSKVNLRALASVIEIQRASLDQVVKEIYRIQDTKNVNPSQQNIPSVRLGKTTSGNLPNLSTLPGWNDGDDCEGEEDEEEGEEEEGEEEGDDEEEEEEQRDEENEEENERDEEKEKEKEKGGGEERKKTSVQKKGEISKEMEEVKGKREMAKRKREAIPFEGEGSRISEENGQPRKDESYSSRSKSGSENESNCDGAEGHDFKRQRNTWEGDSGSVCDEVGGRECGRIYEATENANRHGLQTVSVSVADSFSALPPLSNVIPSKTQNVSTRLPNYPYPYKSSKKLYDILSSRLYGILAGGCADTGGSNRGPSGAFPKRNVCFDVSFGSFWKLPNALAAIAPLHEGGGGQGEEGSGSGEEGRSLASRQGSKDRRYRFEFDGGARRLFGAAATTAAKSTAKANEGTPEGFICSSAVIFRDSETEEIVRGREL